MSMLTHRWCKYLPTLTLYSTTMSYDLPSQILWLGNGLWVLEHWQRYKSIRLDKIRLWGGFEVNCIADLVCRVCLYQWGRSILVPWTGSYPAASSPLSECLLLPQSQAPIYNHGKKHMYNHGNYQTHTASFPLPVCPPQPLLQAPAYNHGTIHIYNHRHI